MNSQSGTLTSIVTDNTISNTFVTESGKLYNNGTNFSDYIKQMDVGMVRYKDGSIESYVREKSQQADLLEKVTDLESEYEAFLAGEGKDAGEYFSSKTGRKGRKIVAYGVSMFDRSKGDVEPLAGVNLSEDEAIMFTHYDIDSIHADIVSKLGTGKYSTDMLKLYAFVHEFAHTYQSLKGKTEDSAEKEVEQLISGYFRKKAESSSGEEKEKYTALAEYAEMRYSKVEKNYPRGKKKSLSMKKKRSK